MVKLILNENKFNEETNSMVQELVADEVSKLSDQLKNSNCIVELFGKEDVSSGIDERTKRKDKIRQFTKLYENDTLTFGLVNYLVQKIVPSYIFIGEDKAVTKLNDWAKRKRFKRTLESILLDAVLAGTAWTEPIISSIEIEKIQIINPDLMDLIRDNMGNTIYDDEYKPLGYVQEVNGRLRYWYKDRIEEQGNILFKASKNTDLRDKIKYFKLIGYGDSELGLSLIQPIYRSAIIRNNIEDMIGESGFRGGGIVAYIDGELPADVKKNLKNDLQNITSKNIFLLSQRIKLDSVPVPDIEQRENLIYLLADLESAGVGIPLEALMTGSKNSRAGNDVNTKMSDFEVRVTAFQERFAEQINDNIITPMLKIWKMEGQAEIRFSTESPANQLNRARVIATLARRNLMTYDPEVEMQIRKELKLPTTFLSEQYELWKKTPVEERGMSAQPEEGQQNDNFNKGDANDNDIDKKDDKKDEGESDGKEKGKQQGKRLLKRKSNKIPEGG